MAVQFILGAAGSGKSSYCIEQIKQAILQPDRQSKPIFLVPEQATYQVERKILADERIGGYSDAYIVSFNRLGFWLSGDNIALETLTKTAERLLISRILRENRSRLRVFGQLADKPGMVEKMAAVIRELYQSGKTSLDLGDIIRSRQQITDTGIKTALQKFADIALIYDEYVNMIAGRFENPDARLSIIRDYIGRSDLFRDCRLWVDGFSGFTFAEYEVLAELFKVCRCASVALCIGSQDREHIFAPVIETKNKLEDIIKSNNITLQDAVVLDAPYRFRESPQLAHIEENIFVSDKKIKSQEAVKIINPVNINTEVEYIAGEINSLVFEHNYRYRDIALILSDVDEYAVYLRQVFEDFKIPYFIDRPRSCSHHPLIHLLTTAMRVVKNGFDRVDVFAFLKNPLTNIDGNEVYMLENYCICEGIDKRDWLGDKKWNCSENTYGFDEHLLNKVRRQACKHLLWLNESIGEHMEAAKFADVVLEFLERLEIRQTMQQWQQNTPESSEHSQVYEQTMQVLNEIAAIFEGDKLNQATLMGSLCDCLAAIKSTLIPPGQDQVTVSQIERSRLPDVKAVFIAGAIAKRFPISVSDSSLLTDYDRSIAAEEGCILAEGRQTKLEKLCYLSYVALTRASQRLYISYPQTNGIGKKQQKADIVNGVWSLFEELEEIKPIANTEISTIRNKRQLKDYLCSGANSDENNIAVLKGYIAEVPELADCVAVLDMALAYDNKACIYLDDKNVAQSDELRTSVSRLQTYANCPYKYFANYMLLLKPRELFVYDPLSKGKFYHEILDGVSKELLGQSRGFADVSEQELTDIAACRIDDILRTDIHFSSVINSSMHNGYIFETMKAEVFELLRTLRLMAAVSNFKLDSSEHEFGFGGNACFELSTSEGKNILIKGKIDRIDLDKNNHAVIYDYKSRSSIQVDFKKLYYGTDIQLPSYMLYITLSKTAYAAQKAVGAFFVPIARDGAGRLEDGLGELQVRKARGICNEQYCRDIDNSLVEGGKSDFYAVGIKKDGGLNKNQSGDMFTSDEIEQILDFTKNKICELGSSILSGDISIKPLIIDGKPVCRYCDYKPLCRFDRQINRAANIYYPAGIKKNAFFEILAKEQVQ